MQEFINIFEDYTVFCKQADEFIKSAKEYYLKKELENGKDVKELCKKAARSFSLLIVKIIITLERIT